MIVYYWEIYYTVWFFRYHTLVDSANEFHLVRDESWCEVWVPDPPVSPVP